MKVLALALLLLISGSAFAAQKPHAEYQDAVLQSFQTIRSGQFCSGSTDGTVSDNGDISASTSTNCRPKTTAQYTIVVGQQTLVISPTRSGKSKAGAMFSMGYSAMFWKDSCLYGELPGAHILIRSDNGIYHVKVGKRESLFRLVAAQ